MKNHPFLPVGLFGLCALLVAAPLCAQQPGIAPSPTPPIQTGGTVAAATAAEVWLALVDDGQYEKAWDNGAKILQGVVAKKDWLELARTKRPPLGKVVSRKMQESTAMRSLPGAPEGDYVSIRYNTEFEHKKPVVETVTVAMDPSGQWKVSGYYLR